MLSNKMTFSLTSLAVLLAFGFAFAPVAMAGVDTEPEPTLNSIDVSAAPGPQIEVFEEIGANPRDPPCWCCFASSNRGAATPGAIDTQTLIDDSNCHRQTYYWYRVLHPVENGYGIVG